MIKWVKANRVMLLALLVVFVYLSPVIFFPERARFVVHDNLDSNVVWYKNLAESGKMFASNNDTIARTLGGIQRGCYPSEYNLMHWWYVWFSPLTAYSLNIIVIHLVAFFSMLLYARRYLFRGLSERMSIYMALVFALLPFWPSGGLAITAQPLLFYALLNILNNDLNWKNWLIVTLIPLYSVFALSNFFFMIVLALGFLVYCIWKKKINFYFVLAAVLFVSVSILAEYRLFAMQFIEHFESHRVGMKAFGSLNLKGVIGVSLLHFLKGQYHFHSLQFPFILLIALVTLIAVRQKKVRLTLLGMLTLAYIISLLFVLPDWQVFQQFMLKSTLLKSISLRFYSLFPLLWFSILGYSCYWLIKEYAVAGKVIPFVFLLMGIFSVFSVNDRDYFGTENAENSFFRTCFDQNNPSYTTFSDQYQTALFERVKQKIVPGSYYIGCIGISPEIAQFNGYNTIDAYYYYYSKKYNEFMTSILRKELDKGGKDVIGSRCYLYCDDLERGKKVIDSLSFDFGKMKQLKTKYLFSIRKILNKNLVDELVFSDGKRQLFVYSIK